MFAYLSSLFAQPGGLDQTFNSNDLGYGYGDGTDYRITCSAVQLDGKVILGGLFTRYNGNLRKNIVRTNINGNVDTSFHVESGFGGAVGGGNLSQIFAVKMQNDGKIIVVGDFMTYNGISRKGIVRLNSDGSLDTSFNPGTGANNQIQTVAIQNDGKFIIGGLFSSYNGTSINRIARINSDGSLDASFNPGPGANNQVQTVAIQNDGKIIIGGYFSSYNGTSINGIARINSNGSIDNTFNVGSGTNDFSSSIIIQNDGKIIIAGNFTTYNGTSINRIARLNSNGTVDASFNPGSGPNAYIRCSSIQDNGKIIIGGSFTSFNGTLCNYLTRINSDGSIDTSFNPGTGTNGEIYTTVIQNDGEIIIGGEFIQIDGVYKWNVARLNGDGSLDEFNQGTGISGYGLINDVNTTSIQSDGKIIIGGYFYKYNGVIKNSISRINSDGSIDNTFNSGTGTGELSSVLCSTIQSDGKIIIGGGFSFYDGTLRNNIARINSDGTIDNSFNTSGTFPNGTIYSIAIQPDGKIIIAGTFTYNIIFNGNVLQVKNIARLNSNGSLDATFNLNGGAGANTAIKNISIQIDGKIIIGGQFTTFNGITKNYLARLNSDGSLDATFNSGTGANGNVLVTKIQNDGKIIIAGMFTTYNGTTRNKIARLNLDGTIDPTFNPGVGADLTIYTIAIQSNGKMVIGGGFSTYNGIARRGIARLNSDGTLDSPFNPGTGTESYINTNTIGSINTSSIQNDGKIIIGGNLIIYDGIGRNRIARLYGGEPCIIATSPLTTSTYCAGASFNVSYSFTGNLYAGNLFTAQLSDANGNFASPINIGTLSSTTNGTISVTIPISQPFGTNYRIRVVSSQPIYTGADNGNNITINTVPTLPGSINGNTTVCSGTANSYNINSVNGASSYTWSLPGGWSGSSSSNSINITSGLNGGNILVSANNSCGSSPSQILYVNVNSSVPSTPGLITGNNNICDGSSMIYSTGGVIGATSYTWILPNGWSGSSSTTSINVTSSSVGGDIEVKANNSCGSSLSQILSVIVNTLPNVNAGNDQTICQGETLTLAANGATTYSWNNGVVNNIAFTPTASNSYIVNGTDVNGCQDSDTVIVNVNSNSSSQLTQTATGTYTLNGQTYSQSGTYTQVIPNANGCDSTITLNLTINGAGINEVSTTIFNIYPNPAKNQFQIDFDGQINKLEIIDTKGALIYTAFENKEEYMLPNHIQMGYYLVVIHTDEGIFRKELLIEK